MRRSLLLAALLVAAISPAQRGNPFAPPNAKIQVAPISGYDLLHVRVTLDVDYAGRAIRGSVKNTLKPLAGGLNEIKLHAAETLIFDAVTVNGMSATHRRDGQTVIIDAKGLKTGENVEVLIDYHSTKTKEAVSFGGGGWHWIEPNGINPNNVGFWTQGETQYNREWAPLWDYPNDFATTESVITVPKGWSVIGNGGLVASTESGDKITWHWKQEQPHATYLLSLAAGPLDIKRDGTLWYITPGGKGHLIPASYGDTPDMMSFFGRVTGVPYPWVKYAQNAMIDFGGGMENISSTHLGADSLTDGKDAFRAMSSLNSHELAHQWFGDLVTCRDWGHIWLNESFATYMQWAYFEHSQGKKAYEREVTAGVGEYLGESRRYKRPLATNMYPDPDSMFDSHAYPKGGAVLHTLRRQLGDKKFYDGLKKYLTDNRHRPVDSEDLRKAMTAASGVDLREFWDQWIYKPGHPVLSYDWAYADGKLTITVAQKQDTATGTPIYRIPAKFATITGGKVTRHAIELNAAENKVILSMPRPDAVVLDPDLDFLREISHAFDPAELPAIAEFAPNAVDRANALSALTRQEQPDLKLITRLLDQDNGQFPVYPSIGVLTRHAAAIELPFWHRQIQHPDFNRRAEAVNGLAAHREKPQVALMLAGLVSDSQPTFVVVNALNLLDPKANRDTFIAACSIPSLRSEIKATAFAALAKAGDADVLPMIFAAGKSEDEELVRAAVAALAHVKPSAETRALLTRVFEANETSLKRTALIALRDNKDPELKPALLKISEDLQLPRDIRDGAKKLIAD